MRLQPSARGPSAPVPSNVDENWAGVDMMDYLDGRWRRQSLVSGEPRVGGPHELVYEHTSVLLRCLGHARASVCKRSLCRIVACNCASLQVKSLLQQQTRIACSQKALKLHC